MSIELLRRRFLFFGAALPIALKAPAILAAPDPEPFYELYDGPEIRYGIGTPGSVVTDRCIEKLTDLMYSPDIGPINIVEFRLGEPSADEGLSVDTRATDVTDQVFHSAPEYRWRHKHYASAYNRGQETLAMMRAQITGQDTVVFMIHLPTMVGPFRYGNIGLFDDAGEMLFYSVLPQQRTKIADAPPHTIGNELITHLEVKLSRAGSALRARA